MEQIKQGFSLIDQISQQELHHLITVSTGFIDAYIVNCYQQKPMFIPQNIVLSALDSATQVSSVEWHELQLPVYRVSSPDKALGVALVIEGENLQQRFALMCDEMPKTIRLRISEVVDDPMENTDPMVFQYVRMEDEIFHIPHLVNIQKSIGIQLD